MRMVPLTIAVLLLLGGALPARAVPSWRSLSSRLKREKEDQALRRRLAKKRREERKKKKKKFSRRYWAGGGHWQRAGAGAAAEPGHRVAATGRVLSRPEAERLARRKVSAKTSERFAQRLHSYRGPGVDARGVSRMSVAERRAAQSLPSAQLPRGLRRRAAAPPQPQLASMPGAGLLDGLARVLTGRWGQRAAPTIAAVTAKARQHGIETALLAAITDKESTGRYWIRSKANAQGAMQVKPGTAADVGVHGNLYDPMTGVEAGARYFKRLLARFGDPTSALAHYYSGENSRKPNWAYAQDVLRRYRQIRGSASVGI